MFCEFALCVAQSAAFYMHSQATCQPKVRRFQLRVALTAFARNRHAISQSAMSVPAPQRRLQGELRDKLASSVILLLCVALLFCCSYSACAQTDLDEAFGDDDFKSRAPACVFVHVSQRARVQTQRPMAAAQQQRAPRSRVTARKRRSAFPSATCSCSRRALLPICTVCGRLA